MPAELETNVLGKPPDSSLGMPDGQSPEVSAWSPLAEPIFRALWIVSVTSNIGTLMQNVGAAWLMTTLSASPLMVSLVQTATNLPVFLLALPAGALADVFDRRAEYAIGVRGATEPFADPVLARIMARVVAGASIGDGAVAACRAFLLANGQRHESRVRSGIRAASGVWSDTSIDWSAASVIRRAAVRAYRAGIMENPGVRSAPAAIEQDAGVFWSRAGFDDLAGIVALLVVNRRGA